MKLLFSVLILTLFFAFTVMANEESGADLLEDEPADLGVPAPPLDTPAAPVEDEAAADSEALDHAVDAATALCQDTCRAASRAFAPDAANPCDGTRIHPSFFCPGTDYSRVNPFALIRALQDSENVRESKLSRVCIQYLLQKAQHEIQDADQRLILNAQETQVAEIGKALFMFHGDCQNTFQDPGLQGLVTGALGASATGLTITANQGVRYCNIVGKGCAWLGGRERRIGGQQVCVSGGMVLDQSCLDASAAKQKRLRYAVRNVKGSSGLGCLSSMNESAGQSLRTLLRAREPNTRVCCGPTCQTPLEGFPTESASSSGSSRGRTTGGDSSTANIHLYDDGFGSNRETAGTLFHEYLHRIGMCTHPNHDDNSKMLVADQTNLLMTSCRKGFSEYALTSGQASEAGNCDGTNMSCIRSVVSGLTGVPEEHVFPRIPNDGNPGGLLMRRGDTVDVVYKFCLRENMCGGGFISVGDLNARDLLDPVYACENACFGSFENSTGRRALGRQICSATAAGHGSTCDAQRITEEFGRASRGSP